MEVRWDTIAWTDNHKCSYKPATHQLYFWWQGVRVCCNIMKELKIYTISPKVSHLY